MSLKRESVGSAVLSLRFRPFQMCSQQESAVGSGARRNRFVRIQSNSHQSVVSIQSNSEPEQALRRPREQGARSENQERYQMYSKRKRRAPKENVVCTLSFTPRSQRPEPRARLHPTSDPVPVPRCGGPAAGVRLWQIFLGFFAVSVSFDLLFGYGFKVCMYE